MKKLFLIVLVTSGFVAGCSKNRQDVPDDIALFAMVNGKWRITKYFKGTVEHTSDFNTYRFEFKENRTVNALNNGLVENTGSWEADPGSRTITSVFTNAGPALRLLNGTWLVTDNSWTFVEAKQTLNGTDHKLRLDKE
jgi:hypothetical protein